MNATWLLATGSSGLRWGDILTVQYNSVRGGQKEELGQGRILRRGCLQDSGEA